MPLRTRDPQKKMEIRAGRLQRNGLSQSSEPKNWPSLKTCWGHTVAMLALTCPRPCQALQALSVVALPVYIPKDSAWQIEAAGRISQRVRLPCKKIPRNGIGSVRGSQRMASRQSSDAKGQRRWHWTATHLYLDFVNFFLFARLAFASAALVSQHAFDNL
jgi:hypothetical protein